MTLELDTGAARAEPQTLEHVAAQIGLAQLDPSVPQFHRLWYESKHTWAMVRYKGVPLLKNPLDLWIYHELIWEIRPGLIIETGTCFGGSALFFADQMADWHGRVISIDLHDKRSADACVNPVNQWPTVEHDRIQWIVGDSLNPTVIGAVRTAAKQTTRPVLVSLDSDHHMAHVAHELEAYAPMVTVGSYCVVEDTNVSGRPIVANDPGPGAAADAYVEAHPEFLRNALCERFLLSFSPGGWLSRVR